MSKIKVTIEANGKVVIDKKDLSDLDKESFTELESTLSALLYPRIGMAEECPHCHRKSGTGSWIATNYNTGNTCGLCGNVWEIDPNGAVVWSLLSVKPKARPPKKKSK